MAELVLFDDAVARDWQPFTLTRPGGELRFGAFTQRERGERALGAPCVGHLGCPELAGFSEPEAVPVLERAPEAAIPRFFLSSRVVLDTGGAPAALPEARTTLLVEGRVAGWYVPAGGAPPGMEALAEPESAPRDAAVLELTGTWLTHVWELVSRNTARLVTDLEGLVGPPRSQPPAGLQLIGWRPGMLQLGSDVVIEPHVVLDFTDGPIRLEDRVTVRAFTRLAGPACVAHDSVLLGGPYAHVSVGPVCKVHGELEASVVLGYSNKAHDGFLGHAYLGCWVNLGAMTTNSDLKNNYGSVRLWTPRGSVDTGEMKIGCLLGDHVKTGIGALLNTGTVVGAGSNLFGTAMPPKYVPPFSWGSGGELEGYDVEKFLATAELAMGRRQVALDEGMRTMLRGAWQRGRAEPA